MIEIQKITVKDVMATPVAMIDGKATVKEAAKKIMETGYRALIVDKVSEDDAYGIVTVQDIVYKVIIKGIPLEKVRVLEIMSKPCITVPEFYDIKMAAKIMERAGVLRLPVVSANFEIVGMVTLRDLIKPFI